MRAGRFFGGVAGLGAVLIGFLMLPARPARAAVIYSVTFGNNRINKQDADTGASLQAPFAPPAVAQNGGGNGLAASATELFYSTIDNQTIYRLNPATGAVLGSFLGPVLGIDALAYGPSNFGLTLFAQDYTANRMYLLNPTTGAQFTSYLMSFDAVGGIDFDPTTNLLWVTSSDANIRTLNPNTGAVVNTINIAQEPFGVGIVDGRLFTGSGTTISERNKTTGAVTNSFSSVGASGIGALAGITPEPGTVGMIAVLAAPAALSRRRKKN
jgi:hypothetical protein